MKLSILFFVLTAIIYKCHGAPAPDWVEDLKRDIQKMNQEMHENQQQMDKTFKALGQQFENTHKSIEDQIKNLGDFTKNGTAGLQDLNGINTNIVHGQSTISTSQTVNGHRIDTIITENIINNVLYRTVIEYDSATNKTTKKTYECTLPPNSQCEQKSNEVSDGPLGSFN